MKELIKIENNGVSAYDLYCALEVKTKFAMWIKRRFSDYSFTEGQDFFPFLGESSGGRPREDYALSIDCAKEISLVEKTAKGKEIRKYFIEVENRYKKMLLRDSSKQTRLNFTDVLKMAGENDRMHGFGYSSYTKLVYKKLGIEYVKQDNFRDTLTEQQLKAVEAMEKLIDGYLRMGFEYEQIKSALPDFLVKKETKEVE